MRVAMISLHTNPVSQPGTGNAGGMNVYVDKLSEALGRLGINVDIFTRSEDRRVSAKDKFMNLSPKVRMWQIPTKTLGVLPKEQLNVEVDSFTERALEIIATRTWSKGVQLVHSHYWLSGMAGLQIASELNIPLVHAMHTMGKVKNAALPPGDIPEPPARLHGEALIAQKANALIAATQHEALELETLYHADPQKVFVIPPGVDSQLYQPGNQAADRRHHIVAKAGIPENAKIVLFAGRIQRLKNPSVLVEALPELPPDTYLVILGGVSGHSIGETELRDLAQRLGVSDRVRIMAPVQNVLLAQWYQAADVVAVPSYTESYGLVAAEAIASGCPVVAAKVGGLLTVVEDGVTGLLVDSHQPHDWATAINRVLTDDGLRARLAANCARDNRLYDWQRTAEETLAVYRALVSGS